MRPAGRRGLTLFATLACTLVGSMSRADEDTTPEQKAAAQALFEQARSLVEQDRFAEACPKLAESERLDPGIGTLLWLADCYENVGQTASAWASFKEAAAGAALKHDNRERVARERAARLESKLSRLTINVAAGAAVDGFQVHRDGMLVGTAEWGLPLPLDPGTHTVTATAPKRQSWSSTVQVAAGQVPEAITIPALAPEANESLESEPARDRSNGEAPGGGEAEDHHAAGREPMAAPSEDSHRGDGQRIAGVAVAGAGLAGIVVGAVYSLDAKAIYDRSNDGGHCLADNECDAAGITDRSRASSMALAATISMGVGAAAAAGGALLFFVAPRPAPASVAVAPARTGASVRLTWAW
jgi:hypothetical protein